MNDAPDHGSELGRLLNAVDAEIEEARNGTDPVGSDDCDGAAYETRLRGLHDAVVALQSEQETRPPGPPAPTGLD